ncbi:MAG: S-methyl-5'-thioadenosine phosphorylase [Anaerolineae bacterium]|nr:S-methyl-5'-thioadenosine phosphorylase [Anaerolineae bacterium]
MESIRIGVIGGSGLYNMPELAAVEEQHIETPYGLPSDTVLTGMLAGQRIAFIPRHGRGHTLMPSEVPYRANIYALKVLGVRYVIGVSACGSLREGLAPGHIVIPNQLIDWTRDERGRTFFGDGLVAHVPVGDPFCPTLSALLADAVKAAGGTVQLGGTSITIEGPRFSTRGESMLYRSWGLDIIGMTTSPEAFLAREAEMCYAVMAHVTDYDVWHDTEEAVTVEIVLQTLKQNLRLAQQALVEAVKRLAVVEDDCACHHALATALLTDADKIPTDALARVWPLVKKYYGDDKTQTE